jgi:hypothetical protein
LIDLYHLEAYLFQRVSSQFAEEQTLTPFDFFAIVIWKSNRVKTRVKKGLNAAGKSVQALMCEVAKTRSPADKVELLTEIEGIGIRVASAILAVCYPTQFTVLDYRAWETLASCNLEGLPASIPTTPAAYVRYCEACGRFAAKGGVSLRDLDQALWARSWEKDLRVLIEGMKA